MVVLFLLAACSPAYADPTAIAGTVDPKATFARLGEVSSLDEGASQFASAINVDPTLVRIRIQPGDCSLCRIEASPKLSKVEGLTVDEALKLVEEQDQVSFFVPKFSCTFLYDGSKFAPKSCQISPV
ncbi:MAG: hypothetical protein U0175_21955 [Caldilineaceae bacterium]